MSGGLCACHFCYHTPCVCNRAVPSVAAAGRIEGFFSQPYTLSQEDIKRIALAVCDEHERRTNTRLFTALWAGKWSRMWAEIAKQYRVDTVLRGSVVTRSVPRKG